MERVLSHVFRLPKARLMVFERVNPKLLRPPLNIPFQPHAPLPSDSIESRVLTRSHHRLGDKSRNSAQYGALFSGTTEVRNRR